MQYLRRSRSRERRGAWPWPAACLATRGRGRRRRHTLPAAGTHWPVGPRGGGGGCPEAGNVRLSRDVECSLSVEWPGARARLYIGGGRSGRRPCDIESFIALWGWIPILSRWICISSLGYAFLHLSFECSALVIENLFLWHPAITKCASIPLWWRIDELF